MSSSEVEDDLDEENCFKILVATDIHLGYMDTNPIRKNDALNSFEEILEIGKEKEVDFILLGGDLFHDNKPSRATLHGCMKVLRKHCLGDKPCPIKFLSDPSTNFSFSPFPFVNYSDPNINISMPIFSIHGNHDDPCGPENLSSLDLLHTSGFINYFGKVSNIEKIQLAPMFLEKGSSRLAIYGLGSIRDERLHRMFIQKKVKFLRPEKDKDSWFNLFVIHQNRSQHGPKNHIPEQFLDNFLDLVLWGHEHECKIDPSWNGVQRFYVTQPGSSVATSVCEGEVMEKHVGLLYIKDKNFRIEKIKLNSVRQLYMETVVLSTSKIKPNFPDTCQKVEAYCSQVVENLLTQAEVERASNKKIPEKPLIGLKVDISTDDRDLVYEMPPQRQFCQKFQDRVANYQTMLTISVKKSPQVRIETDLKINLKSENLEGVKVEDMVKRFFNTTDEKGQLNLLNEAGICEALKEFVDKEEKDAFNIFINYQLQKTQEYLMKRNFSNDEIFNEIQKFKDVTMKKNSGVKESVMKEAKTWAGSSKFKKYSNDDDDDDDEFGFYDDNEIEKPKQKKSDRGRGRGRGSRGGSRKTSNKFLGEQTSRMRKKATLVEEEEEEEDFGNENFWKSSNSKKKDQNITSFFSQSDAPSKSQKRSALSYLDSDNEGEEEVSESVERVLQRNKKPK